MILNSNKSGVLRSIRNYQYRFLYLLNPMAGILDGYRSILVKHTAPEWTPVLYGVAGAVIVFYVGYLFFKSLEMRFADVV